MNTSTLWEIKDLHRLSHWSACADLSWALADVPSIEVLRSLYEGLRAGH